MNTSFRDLKLRQTAAMLAAWRDAVLPARPANGWIRAIREALGMPARTLAQRLDMTDAGLRSLERAEAEDAITLATLRKVAAALDCELKYALVPKTPLPEVLEQQAQHIARERVKPVAHSMKLESQGVDAELTEQQIQQLAQDLLKGSWRELWR